MPFTEGESNVCHQSHSTSLPVPSLTPEFNGVEGGVDLQCLTQGNAALDTDFVV